MFILELLLYIRYRTPFWTCPIPTQEVLPYFLVSTTMLSCNRCTAVACGSFLPCSSIFTGPSLHVINLNRPFFTLTFSCLGGKVCNTESKWTIPTLLPTLPSPNSQTVHLNVLMYSYLHNYCSWIEQISLFQTCYSPQFCHVHLATKVVGDIYHLQLTEKHGIKCSGLVLFSYVSGCLLNNYLITAAWNCNFILLCTWCSPSLYVKYNLCNLY